MALSAYKVEPIEYFELWEKSPRLPRSIQKRLDGLTADEKIAEAAEYYIQRQEVLVIASAMSAVGFSPIEITNGIHRDGKIVLFDGNRRLMAAKLLLDPSLAKGVKLIQADTSIIDAEQTLINMRNTMSEDLLDTLKEIPVIEFNSHVYTLESAALKVAKIQFSA